MTMIDPIYVGNDAIGEFLQYCQQHDLSKFVLVCDNNTFEALGSKVEQALKEQSHDVVTIIHTGEEVVADEHFLLQTLVRAPVEARMFIAVGSGTLTDITRFVSHRTHNKFISFPTAASVDAFTSIGAPLVLDGVKQTIVSQPPVAVFADLRVLMDAPPALSASGFGDMLGKVTSLADWQLGKLLWGEPYDEDIARRARTAVENVLDHAEGVGKGEEESIRYLIEGLNESGLCMMEFGTSRPASGAEHHISHYLEMKLLQENRPAILHGAKVGVATLLVAKQYEKIRAISREEMMDRLEAATLPDRSAEIDRINEIYGDMGGQVAGIQARFLDMTEDDYDQLKRGIAENWDAIQEVAAQVPDTATLAGALEKAGAATDMATLGFNTEEVDLGYMNGHYLRDRFTVMKLSRVLDAHELP